MDWNAQLYNSKHDYVAEYGKGLLEYVQTNKEQIILDLGCGTGSLTDELSKRAKKVIGIDGSETMIAKAKKIYPTIDFIVMDACELIWKNHFDIVFSNAVFHWIQNQDLLLKNIYKALTQKGKLVCEFGASGNIVKIQNAFQTVLEKHGYIYTNQLYFPTTNEYEQCLKQCGFEIELLIDFDRPTPLNDKEFGLKNWMTQFFAKDMLQLSDEMKTIVVKETEVILKPELWDGRQWIADYRRIRAVVCKGVR